MTFLTKIFRSPLAVATFTVLALGGTAQAQSNPYLGTISTFGLNFCPRGWAAADGQLLPINQNQSLYSLFGTYYGGDGRTTFGLPDLRGRRAISVGQGPGLSAYAQGQRGGIENLTLNDTELPTHNHIVNATNADGTKGGPGTDFLAVARFPNGDPINLYSEGPPNRQMDPGMISSTGGGRSFNIVDPYQVVEWCVATVGIFPPRN
ncbi:phage tail protein [Puniceibacterium sp. IMCC21224]|uniref:phage tail protein n=1 Tax=Puniceibacterium sp. IMCC21224 TaxID=1618204 RepID=UPI00065CD4A9|nr:tail fiber protein [Puniceibacterium sp. IMCC21224]KMK67683.1 phage tail collar family protein [Puniceibacterium sp. IMCC21224]